MSAPVGDYVTGHLADLAGQVCRFAEVPPVALIGQGRGPRYVVARTAYAVGARRLGASWPEIARAMGRTSHAGIFDAARRYEAGVGREAVDRILAQCPTLKGSR